jgi:hypothetical protein
VELVRIWAEADNGDVFEVAIRPHLIPELERRWPPFGLARYAEQPGGPVVGRIGLSDRWVIIPDVEVSGDDPPLLAWDQLEQSLTVFAAHRLDSVVAVHAAAFAWGDRAVIVPAPSGGGKSTLTVAAADAGAKVLTDEYALLDPSTGRVTGWHRAVRLLRNDGGVDRLHLATPHVPMIVGLVASISHVPGGANAFSPISAAEAVGRILEHTLCARDRSAEAFEAAVAVARGASAVSGNRGEAAEAVIELRTLLEHGVAPQG